MKKIMVLTVLFLFFTVPGLSAETLAFKGVIIVRNCEIPPFLTVVPPRPGGINGYLKIEADGKKAEINLACVTEKDIANFNALGAVREPKIAVADYGGQDLLIMIGQAQPEKDQKEKNQIPVIDRKKSYNRYNI